LGRQHPLRGPSFWPKPERDRSNFPDFFKSAIQGGYISTRVSNASDAIRNGIPSLDLGRQHPLRGPSSFPRRDARRTSACHRAKRFRWSHEKRLQCLPT